MAVRKIVRIDEEKCDGCGLCVPSCAEGAIQLVGGKARLVSDVYCDGLGACLGHCPQDAITVEEREAADFDRSAAAPAGAARSQLATWPVQLALVPPNAPYLEDADLLLVADCVPVAFADFHGTILRGNPVVVGCPKLDDAATHVEKLARILRSSTVTSLTVVHMEVPCCGGLTRIAQAALAQCGRDLPVRDMTISIQGEILNDADEDRASPRRPSSGCKPSPWAGR